MSPDSAGERPPGMRASRGQSVASTALQLSLLISFTAVCFPHSNKGGRRSCGNSKRGSSAGTMRSRCAGKRRGGAQSTSRYRGTWEPCRWPRVDAGASRLGAVGHLPLGLLGLSRFLLLLQQLFSPIQEVKCTTWAKPAHSAWLPPQAEVP